MSSESQQSDDEASAGKAAQSTSSDTEGSDKKSETCDTSNTGAEKTSKSTKTSPSKTTGGKTAKKATKDSEPDIKEMVGSPRPVRNESPKPGTSQESVQRQCSSDESENQTPRRPSRQQSSSDESVTRGNIREKPSMVDHVAKNIESLFSLMSKKDNDS